MGLPCTVHSKQAFQSAEDAFVHIPRYIGAKEHADSRYHISLTGINTVHLEAAAIFVNTLRTILTRQEAMHHHASTGFRLAPHNAICSLYSLVFKSVGVTPGCTLYTAHCTHHVTLKSLALLTLPTKICL